MTVKDNDSGKRQTRGVSRRGFLGKLWLLLGGILLAECVWVIITFLRPRKRRGGAEEETTLFIAGPVERFAVRSVTPFPSGKFYLVRLADGGFLALSRKCTHLGCTVLWEEEEERFVCPCHASIFNIEGDVLSAPAPRALDRYAVRIDNEIVKVDAGSPMTTRSTGGNEPD